jgi:four helix bundle protein
MSLGVACHQLAKGFPDDERFGLTSQIRRAAVSSSANIAEGDGRESTGACIQFLRVAQGSQKGLETLLTLASRVGIATSAQVEAPLVDCERVSKMLRNLERSLQSNE